MLVSWRSLEACKEFAVRLSSLLEPPITVRLDGTLGAGKTQFAKFLAEALGADCGDVTSPTFVLIHRYETTPTIYHMDIYRVVDEDEFFELGVEEYFEAPAITLVEWGGKFEKHLPRDHLVIAIEIESDLSRSVEINGTGPRALAIVERLGGTKS